MQRRFDVGSKVYSSRYGAGEVVAIEGAGDGEKLTVRFDRAGEKQLLSAFSLLETQQEHETRRQAGGVAADAAADAPARAPAPRFPTDEVKDALRQVLREELGVPAVGMTERWRGGSMILRPGREGQKEKEIPLDDFFHKIVMLRDRLRVMEQKINSHPQLTDADKVELQQYVTRIYGSLTTFNILFADRDDWFVGRKGEAPE